MMYRRVNNGSGRLRRFGSHLHHVTCDVHDVVVTYDVIAMMEIFGDRPSVCQPPRWTAVDGTSRCCDGRMTDGQVIYCPSHPRGSSSMVDELRRGSTDPSVRPSPTYMRSYAT